MDNLWIENGGKVELSERFRLSMPEADVLFVPEFLPESESNALFTQLRSDTGWEQHQVRLFGRTINCPRLSAWYGRKYSYSGTAMVPKELTPTLADLAETLSDVCGTEFNSVLLNLYRDGSDSMGAHADDEPELGERPVIASLSLGATRRMRFQHKYVRELRNRVDLTNGSLLVMAGETQHRWKHEIPKTRRAVGPRINLTFRRCIG